MISVMHTSRGLSEFVAVQARIEKIEQSRKLSDNDRLSLRCLRAYLVRGRRMSRRHYEELQAMELKVRRT